MKKLVIFVCFVLFSKNNALCETNYIDIDIYKNTKDAEIVIKYQKEIKKTDFKIFQLQKPNRIVVDLTTELNIKLKYPVEPNIGVRYSKKETGYRFVFDMLEQAKLEKIENNEQIKLKVSNAIKNEKTDYIPSKTEQKKEKPKLNNFTVAIDAGHGGKDTGAIGSLGVPEKTLTLMYARTLQSKLNKLGVQTVMTRETDTYISLYDRVKIARQNHADIFISIHADSSPNKKAERTTVFTMKNVKTKEDRWNMFKKDIYVPKQFLEVKDKNVFSLLYDMNRSVSETKTNAFVNDLLEHLKQARLCKDCRKETEYFAVLKSSDVPSLLIEVGFLTNPKEEMKIVSAYHIEKFTNEIVDSLDRFFLNNT